MYVTGFSVWREFGHTDIGNELEFVRGFGDDFFIQVKGGVWGIPNAEQAFALLVNNINNRGMLRDVAQPVTVTVTIGEEGDFDWASPAAPGGDGGEETAPDTYSFSDGSATALNGGVQTYEITTAAQLYGAMPESGSVVHSDGTTKRAAFDWNGFAYDTERSYNVARLSVTSGGDRIDTDVVVTLADNADVNGAADDIGSVPENSAAGVITKIVDPRYRAMAVDPLAYGTLGAFLEGTGRVSVDGAVEVVTEAGDTETMTVVSWSDKLTLDAALPLAGVRYSDNIATFKDAEGNLWQAVVPVIVNERVIVGTELLLPTGFAKVSETRRFSETVRRYVNELGGQVVEVSYSRDTFMPTGITVMNPYAYKLQEVFPDGKADIEITFADGMVKSFVFSVEGITAPASGSDALTLEALKWSVAYSTGTGSAIGGTLDFMYSGLRITGANMLSDIAYGDLDGTADGTHQVFAPYENMKKGGVALTPLWRVDKTEVGSPVTVYIDGRFVPVGDASYTETADGIDAPAYQLLEDHTYDRDGNYVGKEGGDYVYVYAASYTFRGSELTWDCSGIAYNYSGGVRRATVNVEVAGLKGTMQMPVYIESGRIESLSFVNAGDDSAPDYSAYFEGNTEGINHFNANWDGSALRFDPFNADNVMYDIDAAFKTHTEAGSVVIDSYLYFPVKADVVTASGAVIEEAKITWSNLGAIRNSYVGGEFDARITLPAVTEGEGDTAETIIPAQGYTLREFVIVENRSFAEGATLNGIDALPATGRVDAAIDPLTFDLATWQQEVEKVASVNININGKGDVTFEKNGPNGYTLTWVYTGMNVSYLGGKVSLVARLTGPDGYAQDYSIDYLVSRVVVSGLQEYDKIANGGSGAVVSGGMSYTFDTDVTSENFGLAVKDGALDYYVIDPYNPSTFKMPNAWMITYTVSDPVLGEDGSITWTDGGTKERASTYLTAAMPMVENITYEVAKNGDPDAGEATLRLGNGQRVRIKVSITARPYTSTGTPEFDLAEPPEGSTGTWLPTKTSDGINIVWYGRVFVGGTNYIVTLSNPSGDTVRVPEISGRTANYILTPYVGAVVNAAGKVLDWSDTGRLPTTMDNSSLNGATTLEYGELDEDVSQTGRRVPAGIFGTTLVISTQS